MNPELDGSRPGDLLPPAVWEVDDSATVVEQRLEDFLHPGAIRFLRGIEADYREHLAGRRDGPLDHLSARQLQGAEQLRRERQRYAGTSGYSKEFATIDHEKLALYVLVF